MDLCIRTQRGLQELTAGCKLISFNFVNVSHVQGTELCCHQCKNVDLNLQEIGCVAVKQGLAGVFCFSSVERDGSACGCCLDQRSREVEAVGKWEAGAVQQSCPWELFGLCHAGEIFFCDEC